jgi:hypothetical protein
MCALGTGVDMTDRHEVLREPSAVTVSTGVRHRVSFTTAPIPHLQWWNLHWMVSAHSIRDLHSHVP